MAQVGIPLFYLQELAGAQLRFRDLFNDGSLFWGWEKHKTDANRIITEASGVLTIQCTNAGDYEWNTSQNECPKVIIGPISWPCEITTKIVNIPVINQWTQGGLLYSGIGPKNFGSDGWYGIVRRKTATFDGIAVVNSNGVVDFTLVNTSLPVWFKMRLGNLGYRAVRISFLYSYDGMNFIPAFESSFANYSILSPAIVLTAMNGVDGGANAAISMQFDYFIMKPKSIN